ncbi:MAG: M56 family metallopeptidase [Pirellulales bacterium]
MHGVVEALNRWGTEWTTVVVAVVWQSTLVALLVAAAAHALARSSPGVRYWLWQIVAVKLLIVPLWSCSLPLHWLTAESTSAPRVATLDESLIVAVPASVPPVAADSEARATLHGRPIAGRSTPWLSRMTWRGWLFAAWGIIVLVQVGRIGAQRARLSKVLAKAEPGDEHLVAVVGQVAGRLMLKRAPRVVTTELDCSPFVCGILRSVLVLPRELVGTLDALELGQIVAHELAHVKRRDLVWGWIPEIARVLYFFHPVAHWVNYRIRLERELACDQMAMRDSGRTAADYAETLVRVLSAASRPSIFRTSAAAPLDGGVPRTIKDEAQP